jgi:hypothetical protein
MEPLRKCQTARQFARTPDAMFLPCEDYPSCPYCPMQLSDSASAPAECPRCHAVRMTLFDVPPEKLKVPIVCMRDFEKALQR